MRIVSLLPSLTELIHALGRGDWLVGVTHECDFPPGVSALPHLTRNLIPQAADSAAIDALVAAQGGSLYALDIERLASLRPDLILTQAQCDVCAVNEATVVEAAKALPGFPQVVSVNPTNLDQVFAMFRDVGDLLDARHHAEAIINRFQASADRINDLRLDQPPQRLLLLEWVDPPYSSGHWNPEIVGLAGGIEPLAVAGQPSRRVTWEEIAQADPDAILISACGFGIERTTSELEVIRGRLEWTSLRAVRDGRVAITDGSAYFSRPGPRLEESLRIAAHTLDPDRQPLPDGLMTWLDRPIA